MRTTQLIQYTTRPGTAELNEALIRDVFEELADRRPDNIDYTAYRLSDGQTFVHLFSSSVGGAPLADLPAFRRFQDAASERHVAAPDSQSVELIGHYESRADA